QLRRRQPACWKFITRLRKRRRALSVKPDLHLRNSDYKDYTVGQKPWSPQYTNQSHFTRSKRFICLKKSQLQQQKRLSPPLPELESMKASPSRSKDGSTISAKAASSSFPSSAMDQGPFRASYRRPPFRLRSLRRSRD